MPEKHNNSNDQNEKQPTLDDGTFTFKGATLEAKINLMSIKKKFKNMLFGKYKASDLVQIYPEMFSYNALLDSLSFKGMSNDEIKYIFTKLQKAGLLWDENGDEINLNELFGEEDDSIDDDLNADLENFGVSETFSDDDLEGLEDFNVQENFEDDIKLEGQAADFYNAVGESLGLDKKILSKATPQEIQELIDGVKKKQELQDQQEELDKKIEEAQKKSSEFASKAMGFGNSLYGVFKNVSVALSQYEEYKGKFQAKKDYYQSIINDPNQSEYAKNHAKAMLHSVEEFEKLGEEYLQNKDAWLEESQKYGKEYKELLEERNNNNAWIDKFNAKLAIYEDQNDPYSDARRRKAVSYGFNAESSIGNTLIDGVKAIKNSAFAKQSKLDFESLPQIEKNILEYYVGSYHWCNEPLRGENYVAENQPVFKGDEVSSGGNGGKEGFKKGVGLITDALSKCKLKEDMWFQRWTSALDLDFGEELLQQVKKFGAQSVVGKTLRHKNFASMGGSKGTGYGQGKPITMNVYCPKGIEALYFGSTINPSENEILLNRGYTMKIRKCEYEDGHVYVDVDVIVGSNTKELLDKDMEYALNYV